MFVQYVAMFMKVKNFHQIMSVHFASMVLKTLKRKKQQVQHLQSQNLHHLGQKTSLCVQFVDTLKKVKQMN